MMPQTRHIATEQPLETSSQPQGRFEFPENNHLLVTTSTHIFAWDSKGIHTIFKSSKNGIVAAREAQDGSGMLAVANKHVVVLHDTKREQEKSWGLQAEDDCVRHLEYTTDAKSLFLSTNLTADIQRYSVEQSKLLSPSRAHPSPPVALAVSPNGQLMVSASEGPPVVYLKRLQHNSAPILIESRASTSAVSVAAFHPERPNIFLLAFRDGTVAAFDATRIGRQQSGAFASQQHVNAGEISHLPRLHRRMSEANKVASITDAAFLPGYKTRAVTVGHDGRCRLIDFAEGGTILRSWHVKAPVTSVSVVSLKTSTDSRDQRPSKATHVIGGPASTNNLIAIGRVDGGVHFYDSLGLLQCQKKITDDGTRVLNVEWAAGPAPEPIAESKDAKDGQIAPVLSPSKTTKQTVHADKATGPSPKTRRDTTFEHIGLPPALRRPKQEPPQPSGVAPRRFTIHPDEVEDGTVRHTPLPQQSKVAPATKGEYLDLFSPVKPPEAKAEETTEKRVASPPRTRPRISSQTFVKSPEPTSCAPHGIVAKPRNLALFPSTDSGSRAERPQERLMKSIVKQKVNAEATPKPHKVTTFKSTSRRRSRKSGSLSARPPAANNNAKVLADLRKMSGAIPPNRPGGVLSAFGANNADHTSSNFYSAEKENTHRLYHRGKTHIETSMDSINARRAYEEAHVRHNWPEDSNQDSSLAGDIWLTSDSEEDTSRSRSRKQTIERPPARQTSRRQVDSKGTMSTVAQQPTTRTLVETAQRPKLDGSTEEEMVTAESHLSPDGTFSPSSNDVRKLFPRTSSLSPRKRRSARKRSQDSMRTQDVTRKKTHEMPKTQDATLQEVAPNVAAARLPKSPWARAKAHKHQETVGKHSTKRTNSKPVQIFEDNHPQADVSNPPSNVPHCSICTPTQTRVLNLEGEVGRLKGEVLVLKAVLRRNGLPMPPSLRQR